MKKFFETIKKYRFLLFDLTSRDFKIKYRRSVLGVMWSVLNPLLMMLVLKAVFENVFRTGIDNFPVYYLTGSVIYNFFSEATSSSMTSVLSSGSLIKKVYIPKYIFSLEKTLFALVNFAFSLIAVILIFIIARFMPSWTIVLMPIPIIYTFVFSLGVGLILSAICIYFRDIIHLYGVLLTVVFYLTPIIYPVNMLPSFMQIIVKFNPIYHFVSYFRDIVMNGVVPGLTANIICFVCSFGTLLLGILIFKKLQDKFILYI